MDLMSERQWKRWDVMGRLNAGKLTMADGAKIQVLETPPRIRGETARDRASGPPDSA